MNKQTRLGFSGAIESKRQGKAEHTTFQISNQPNPLNRSPIKRFNE